MITITAIEHDPVKDRIIELCRELFYRYGFSKVTMDEIASALSMSKKTIYKYFESKDAIVDEIVARTLLDIIGQIRPVLENPELNFMFKIRHLTQAIGIVFRKIGPVLAVDIQKNRPDLWKEIDAFRTSQVFDRFTDLLKEAVDQGFIRPDINADLFLKIYHSVIQSVIVPEVIVNLPMTPQQVFEEIIRTLFCGVFTDHGRNEFEHIIKEK